MDGRGGKLVSVTAVTVRALFLKVEGRVSKVEGRR